MNQSQLLSFIEVILLSSNVAVQVTLLTDIFVLVMALSNRFHHLLIIARIPGLLVLLRVGTKLLPDGMYWKQITGHHLSSNNPNAYMSMGQKLDRLVVIPPHHHLLSKTLPRRHHRRLMILLAVYQMMDKLMVHRKYLINRYQLQTQALSLLYLRKE